MSIFSNLLSYIYDIKEKVTDQEYIDIVTEISNLNNNEELKIYYNIKYINIIIFTYIDGNDNIEIKTHTNFENKVCLYSYKSPDNNVEILNNLYENNIICDAVLNDNDLINNTKNINLPNMKIIKQIIDINKID